jgi:hypothetical protein
MTHVATASTAARDHAAGEDLADQLQQGLNGDSPDAILVFISPENDYQAVLSSLQTRCGPGAMIGCSSAGEFTADAAGTGMSTAFALRNPDMRFSASMAVDLNRGRDVAARDLVRGFRGLETPEFAYRTAIVLVDALAGMAEDLVDQLTLVTGGMYQFAGGGAGDNALFEKTHVFCGTQAASNAAVALEILSNKPIGIGARHGWSTCSPALRVTEASDACVSTMNVSPAADAFEDHANLTGQRFDRQNPMPFFLHNIVGIKTDEGHKLRVPLGVNSQGGVAFAAEVPVGATAQIMSTEPASAVDAAASAVRDAVTQVEAGGARPSGALFFDCVATRLRLGDRFGDELTAVRNALGDAKFAGFNSYGQIVRADGQFSGFHNCTAVVAVFPD